MSSKKIYLIDRAVVSKVLHGSHLQFDVRLKDIAFCDVKPDLGSVVTSSTFPLRTCDVLSVFHFNLKK